MRVMVWKEWRENARWSALALIALSLALGYSLYAAGLNTSPDPASGLWNGIAPVFLFGCPLLGAALGFAQVMPELRRDQWAFLVHRPVPRTTLFWGKAATGLLLALGATALPLGLLGLWAALPGDVAAPFDIHLLLPGVAALLTLIPFYFAGMLLALRPARWYGSRALPLAAAVLASILTRTLPEFWMAALAALVFGAVLCLAAWGCFATKGEYVGLPRPVRVGLGITLYAGSGLALLTLVLLITIFVYSLTSHPQQRQQAAQTFYMVNRLGQVLIAHTPLAGAITATDLQGHPVTLPGATSEYGWNFDGLQTTELVSPNRVYPHDGRYTDTGYADPNRYAVSLLNGYSRIVRNGEVLLWYYVPAERRGIGYRQKTRRVFGFLGPTGFSPLSQPDAPRFSVPYPAPTYDYGEQPTLLRYPEAVYLLNPIADPVPTIATLYTAHSPGEIAGVCQLRTVPELLSRISASVPLTVVATTGQFLLYADGTRQFALPREYDPTHYTDISLTGTPDGQKYFFWYKPSRNAQKAAGGSLPEYITETTKTGKVTRRYTLPPLPVHPERPADTGPGFFGLLVPPLATLTAYGISHGEISWGNAYLPLWHMVLVMSVLSGIISAGLMALISRRGGDTRRAQVAWAVAGLLLGVFGVLMLLALRPWPVRVPCPNCGRSRAVDRDECLHCGAGFPRPARDGTEIFDEGAEKNPALEVPV